MEGWADFAAIKLPSFDQNLLEEKIYTAKRAQCMICHISIGHQFILAAVPDVGKAKNRHTSIHELFLPKALMVIFQAVD